MEDHAWLINLQKTFESYKYILRVAPCVTESPDDDHYEEKLNEMERNVTKQVGKSGQTILKRVNIADQNTRYQLMH